MQYAMISEIPGHSVVERTGINIDVDIATVPEDICGTSGVHAGFATSAEIVTVVSSSANDAAAGTGARTVKISGLNANWFEQSETVTLNGVGLVDSVNSYLRVFSFEVLTAGSGGVTAGAISIAQKVTTANIFLVVAAGLNREFSTQYTIPANRKGYLNKIYGRVRKGTASSIDGFVLFRTENGPIQQIHPFSLSSAITLNREMDGGTYFPPKTDILLRVSACSADNTEVVAGYGLVLTNA